MKKVLAVIFGIVGAECDKIVGSFGPQPKLPTPAQPTSMQTQLPPRLVATTAPGPTVRPLPLTPVEAQKLQANLMNAQNNLISERQSLVSQIAKNEARIKALAEPMELTKKEKKRMQELGKKKTLVLKEQQEWNSLQARAVGNIERNRLQAQLKQNREALGVIDEDLKTVRLQIGQLGSVAPEEIVEKGVKTVSAPVPTLVSAAPAQTAEEKPLKAEEDAFNKSVAAIKDMVDIFDLVNRFDYATHAAKVGIKSDVSAKELKKTMKSVAARPGAPAAKLKRLELLKQAAALREINAISNKINATMETLRTAMRAPEESRPSEINYYSFMSLTTDVDDMLSAADELSGDNEKLVRQVIVKEKLDPVTGAIANNIRIMERRISFVEEHVSGPGSALSKGLREQLKWLREIYNRLALRKRYPKFVEPED